VRVLVAGIGNIFNSDDGFGVEVAQRLVDLDMPAGVRVEDYGIRGLHLALELLEGYDLLVLVDAMPRPDEPAGTLFVLEPTAEDLTGEPLDAHRMDPLAVLRMVDGLGGAIGRVIVVGCQPETVEEGMGLSPAVAAAIEPAMRMVEELIVERKVGCSVA
jgi:hydrogenase maturation protease